MRTGRLTQAELIDRSPWPDYIPSMTDAQVVDAFADLMELRLSSPTRRRIITHLAGGSVWDRLDAVLLVLLAPELPPSEVPTCSTNDISTARTPPPVAPTTMHSPTHTPSTARRFLQLVGMGIGAGMVTGPGTSFLDAALPGWRHGVGRRSDRCDDGILVVVGMLAATTV